MRRWRCRSVRPCVRAVLLGSMCCGVVYSVMAQEPLETGDLVEISSVIGYVQQLNMRTTILMTLDGNLAQIPNATVYRAIVSNSSTSPDRRADFVVGIGYDDSIAEAQEIVRKVLADHPVVLKDPEPSVLADSLGNATVSLRVYFWLNGREHSWQKVRSSVIRLVKRAFQSHGVSMPDGARAVVFPQGIPVTLIDQKSTDTRGTAPGRPLSAESRHAELEVVSTKAEAGLYSESIVIEEQAREARPLKEGEISCLWLPTRRPPRSACKKQNHRGQRKVCVRQSAPRASQRSIRPKRWCWRRMDLSASYKPEAESRRNETA